MKNSITEQQLLDIIVDVKYQRMGAKTTICLITLKNGYEVVGSSACVDPENYDAEIGQSIAYKVAFDKLWMLEGYSLQKRLEN